MESVKVFALSMCFSLVIGSILSMIAPNMEKNKIFKVILSAFILSGIISPLYSVLGQSSLPKNLDTVQAIEYKYNKSTMQSIENSASVSLYPIIKDELDGAGITENFGLKLDLSPEKYGIVIKHVNINIGDLHNIKKEKLQTQITKNTGLPINIVVNEREES